ncbi:hypothetical protein LTR35_008291 [Friedmanniomyces endolithicus]|uniref:FAD/NAD(P)-binding domain-containing protein n=1 Tax=Friedmanniomyces endolithicus TaxID=329885 RepID=A0AAN6FJM4_9PEZI|nr:hypothetical protein LTR35_008291 [Friedmanniomyces endolithicus]KAK0296309.1 hypothetical protein LTS00_005142 [Friedmanniomyces endolithicus]KAK0319638.1 hypothetical protein LTR82_009343 [Friedmanniomyces endolithicus]KAK1004931.1 hypothetical protein LTR54_007252 [Friedmanniomyces endolithicus]
MDSSQPPSTRKRVCIIGAGPAGLVAAKTVHQTGRFTLTIYEKSPRIGGLWALDEYTQTGFLAPGTPTNLSRFTVGFSDLDWREVDLRGQHDGGGEAGKGAVPMFPRAWMVGRYLEEFRRRYVPDEVLKLGTEVVRAERCVEEGRAAVWRVESRDGMGGRGTEEFDYLVVASGFFAKPRWAGQGVSGLGDGGGVPAVRTIHSSQFHSLKDLFSGRPNAAGKTILIVGGGNSAGETAAAVAMQLSDAAWSPDTTRQEIYKGCKIIHITPRPIYGLPPYLEYEKDSMTYVPIDLKLYDFSKRPQMESYAGLQTPELRDIVHGALQRMVGGDQSDLGSEALKSPPRGEDRGSVYVALSETYSEFVRSGLIEVTGGRAVSISQATDGEATATVKRGDGHTVVDNIGAVIYATGYTPSTALDFLPDDVKQALQYDPSSARLPLILDQWQTTSTAVPDLAFLGFYEGPYWGIMEMQAKLTADRWINEKELAPQRPYEDAHKMLHLRKAMQEKALDVPQYWFGDYLGYMEDIASHLQLSRNDAAFAEREGCTSPARYVSAQIDNLQADAIMADLHKTWRDCIDHGRFVARAALRAMQGNWNISRKIESEDPAYSGTLQGQASFHPRFPTADKSGRVADLEFVYVESGEFTSSSSGLTMLARRRYVYRYSEADDQLSVWFVKPENDLEVDYLFHDLTFVPPAEARKAGACIAKADHLCVDDMYWTQYTLPVEAIVLRRFEIKHTVKGPQKDYVATTQFTRPLVPAARP